MEHPARHKRLATQTRHPRAGGDPQALDSRLRGSDKEKTSRAVAVGWVPCPRHPCPEMAESWPQPPHLTIHVNHTLPDTGP